MMSSSPDRTLRLTFHGRIIDHLGIQMYQSPIAAIAELIANSWDADAENVWTTLPEQIDDAEIVIRDDGVGMTFEECQAHYLNVGWCRRGTVPDSRSPGKDRPVLGRKGIGKFAGFGIAERIVVETVSATTGEKTVFELDIVQLRGDEYATTEGGEIDVLDSTGPDDSRKANHGTTITLKGLKVLRRPSPHRFRQSMARRFLLRQRSTDFEVHVDGQPLPETTDVHDAEFVFPRDFTDEERPDGLIEDGDWGVESLQNGKKIRWRFVFCKTPIEEEELRGIAIFSRGKLAQRPFFFNLTGGLGGQHGQEYLSGQVQADYIDSLEEDIIATERQRINWEHPEAVPLEEWGQERVKRLLRLWRDRRGEKRRKEIEDRVAAFSGRLGNLPSHEQRIVKRALSKLGSISTLSDTQFQELGEAILLAWEQGRLHDLIDRISSSDELSEAELLNILVEAQVLTALNTAEAVKTKLVTVGGLKLRVERRELETAVRDYIATNPWLISPQWETFRVERSVKKLIGDAALQAKMVGTDWEGRVDLALSSGMQLLILEFMRPGLKLDWDHLSRFERYVLIVRKNVAANTAGSFQVVTGYVVADELANDPAMMDKIQDMTSNGMFAMDWGTLFGRAAATWREFLDILVDRAPDDARLQALVEDGPNEPA